MSGIDDRQRFRQRNLGLVIPNRFSHLPLNSISHTARLASFLLSARALERNSTVHDSPPSPSPRCQRPVVFPEKSSRVSPSRLSLASPLRALVPRTHPRAYPLAISPLFPARSRVSGDRARRIERPGRPLAVNLTDARSSTRTRARAETPTHRARRSTLGSPSRVSERFQSSIETAGVARGRMRGAMKSDVDASKSARDACARRDASRGDARGRTGTDGRR